MERHIKTKGLVNLAILLVVTLGAFAAAHYSGSVAGLTATALLGLGFLVALISFFQMGLELREREERLELDELARKTPGSALFKETDAERFPARRALQQFEKYFSPALAVLLLLLQAGGVWGLWNWTARASEGPLTRPFVCMALFGLLAVILFFRGVYSASTARIERQRLMRPGAGYLLLGSAACVAVVVALGIDGYNAPQEAEAHEFQKAGFYIARGMLVVLGLIGVENLITLVLEIYRPRTPGQEQRLMYESRLVGLLCQPGGLFSTIAQVLDYQFGFKVSEKRFYQFLERNLAWIILAQLGLLLFSSCFVVIEPGEQAILERFGRLVPNRALLEPGIHIKWFWPIDKVYRHRTERIQSVVVGAAHEEEEDEHEHGLGVMQWTVAHKKGELLLLVASRPDAGETNESGQAEMAVPASLVSVHIPVQFQITNLLQWATNYSNPAELLEKLASREVVRYLVNVDFDWLLTSGRQQAAELLRERIQKRADERNMGARIVFVGIQGVHPAVAVAAEYEKVVSAEQEKEGKILEAEGYSAKTVLMGRAEASKRLAEAEAFAARKTNDARAQALLFSSQAKAFASAPGVYAMREYLDVFQKGSAQARKYVLMVTNTQDVFQLNLEDKLRPGIEDVPLPAPKTK